MSDQSAPRLTFRDLQDRLISFVVTRIRNGEYTERRLARVLGVSQPQLHNVLKGVRPLKPLFADRLMRQFEIGILDLLHGAELAARLKFHESNQLPLWMDTVALREPAPRKMAQKEKKEKLDSPYLRRLAG